jgi:LacI family transcriptional regulator
MIGVATRRRTPHGAQATLADVARAAGVSTASASRALGRPELVSEQLKVKVSEAAITLGYVPNVAARALVRRRSGLIGIITGDLDEPGTALALAALDRCLSDAGWALLLASCGKDATPLTQARGLFGRGVEALIFLGVAIPADLDAVRGIESLPCVSVDRTDNTGFAANAGLDVCRAGRLIADYLIQLGHRRMVVVTESFSNIGQILENALQADVTSAGSAPERLNMGEGPVAEGIVNWFAQPHAPTAAICSSDAIAFSVMHACACHGIDVPGRLSVVGFGDSTLARSVSPMLTSVRIPARGAGVAAAEYLLAGFTGRVPDHAELPIKLVVRATTGPPSVLR